MTSKKGGYQIVDIATLTYEQALTYVKCGKVLLVINDEDHTPYFADSIEIGDDEIIITKNTRTIRIADDNSIQQDGELLLENENIYCLTLMFNDDSEPTNPRYITIIIDLGNENNWVENSADFNSIYDTKEKLFELLTEGEHPYYATYGIYFDSDGDLTGMAYSFDGNFRLSDDHDYVTITSWNSLDKDFADMTLFYEQDSCVALQKYKKI